MNNVAQKNIKQHHLHKLCHLYHLIRKKKTAIYPLSKLTKVNVTFQSSGRSKRLFRCLFLYSKFFFHHNYLPFYFPNPVWRNKLFHSEWLQIHSRTAKNKCLVNLPKWMLEIKKDSSWLRNNWHSSNELVKCHEFRAKMKDFSYWKNK